MLKTPRNEKTTSERQRYSSRKNMNPRRYNARIGKAGTEKTDEVAIKNWAHKPQEGKQVNCNRKSH